MQSPETFYTNLIIIVAVLMSFILLVLVIGEYRRSQSRKRLMQLSNEIIDGSAAFIIVLDQNKKILKLNQSLLLAMKDSKTQLLGKTLSLAGLSEANRLMNALHQMELTGSETRETIRDEIYISSDEKLIIDWQISTLKDSSGSIVRYIASGLNVTELERARRELQNLRENTEREERRKLAEELHDEIGNHLFLSNMKLEELRDEILEPNIKIALEELHFTIETIINRTRSLVFELGPMSLEQSGLVNALESLAQHMQNRSGIPIRFKGDQLIQDLEHDTVYFMFNSVREIITNAIKHANAGEILLTVKQQADSVQVEVRDNGIGFDFKKIREAPHLCKGFGLQRLVERCEYFGAELNVDTSSGSTFRITIPITIKEKHVHSHSVG